MTDDWHNDDPRPHFLGPATLIVVVKIDGFLTTSVLHLEPDGVYLGQGDFRFRHHVEKWPEHWFWMEAP